MINMLTALTDKSRQHEKQMGNVSRDRNSKKLSNRNVKDKKTL